FIQLEIGGDDLKKQGFKPGKHFAIALAETKEAKVDGLLKSRDEELDYAVSVIKRILDKKENERN
ncbi:MAG: hypothetical protein GYA35_10165, partial [Thermoanaerobaculaceae bacterium]|nr:hypothetical protein [Thermoanaerobaculaceae bacterium]